MRCKHYWLTVIEIQSAKFSNLSHCICVLAASLIIFIQHSLADLNLWRESFMKVKDGLRSGQSLCEKWCGICETLTGKLWKGYSPHPWRGDRFVPELLGQFSKRLEEVGLHVPLPLLVSLVEIIYQFVMLSMVLVKTMQCIAVNYVHLYQMECC